MREEDLETRIDAVRRFNRFFTRQIGVLGEGLLHSPYSLTEARILFEIAHRDGLLTASDLSRELGLDPGYLSRILARLEQHGLVDKVRSEIDARQRLLSLAPGGNGAFSRPCGSSKVSSAKASSIPSPFSCASTSRATWVGSSTATAFSTPRST